MYFKCVINSYFIVPTKGLLVYQFKATDPDDPKTDNIEYSFKQFGNSASKAYFAIDSVNGKVTLKKRLDFETLDKHVITVMAKEQASTGYGKSVLFVRQFLTTRISIITPCSHPSVLVFSFSVNPRISPLGASLSLVFLRMGAY